MNIHTLNSLTETDRLNLCDIAWFIKGMNSVHMSEKHFSEDHERTLFKVISGISNKLSDEKVEAEKCQAETNGNPLNCSKQLGI